MIRGSQFETETSAEILRRIRMHDLQSSTFFKGQGERYDPIFTPIFVSLGFTGSITIGTATITTASLAAAIATTALTVGVQMLLAPKPPKAESGKIPVSQSIPYRIWAVGTCRLAGALMMKEAVSTRLGSVQAMCGHRIHQYRRFWLHDDVITQNVDNTVEALADGRYGDGKISIWSRLGAATETAYSDLVTYFGPDGIWTNNHRGDGQASLAMIANNAKQKEQAKRFPYGAPQLTAEGDWALVWDFRDPEQDPNNDLTWKFSRNSVLILAWHICFNPFGFHRDYRTALLPVLDMWIEDADICDEDVAITGGGTEKRYECAGFDTTENSPKVGLNSILASCDGWICERGDGAVLITVGKFRESRVETLSEEDITGHQVQYNVLFEDECNRLVAKFNYPATDYTTSDVDFFEDVDAQIAAGRVLTQEMDLSWVTQWRQARRLGLREWLRRQQPVNGSLDVRLSGINAVYSRWVRLSTPSLLPKLDSKVIENKRSLLALTKGGFTMDFGQHPDDIDDLPEGYEGAQPPVPSKPNAAGLDEPVISNVAAIANNGTVYVRVTINDPADDSLTPSIRWRLADDGSGLPGVWTEIQFPDAVPTSGSIVLNSSALPADQATEIEAAFIDGTGRYSEWTSTEDVVTTSDPTPPGSVSSVSVSTGTGEATFNWTAPNSPNYAAARMFWNTVDNFSTASAVSPPEYGSAGSFDSRTFPLTAGVRYGWIVAINRSGVPAAEVPTGAFTVA